MLEDNNENENEEDNEEYQGENVDLDEEDDDEELEEEDQILRISSRKKITKLLEQKQNFAKGEHLFNYKDLPESPFSKLIERFTLVRLNEGHLLGFEINSNTSHNPIIFPGSKSSLVNSLS